MKPEFSLGTEVIVTRAVGSMVVGDCGVITDINIRNDGFTVDFRKDGLHEIWMTPEYVEALPLPPTEEEVQAAIQSIMEAQVHE